MLGLTAAALLLPSCIAPLSVSAGYGSIGVTVTIPAFTEAAYPAALKTALSKPSRYIHPDTRRVEVSVAGAGIATPLTASADIPSSSSTASLTVGSIPAGTARTVTISLYDTVDVLLAQSVSTVDVEGGATTSVTTAAVPIKVTNVTPGPYSAVTPIRGIDITSADAGKTTVYAFNLPNPGAYKVEFGDSPTYTPVLYRPDGQAVIITETVGITQYFTAAAAGIFYAVLTLPTAYAPDGPSLVLDADTRITASGPTLYVDPTLSVFDRQRAFTLTVACGYVTGTPPGILFGLAEGTSKDLSATNGSTIAVTPGATGLNPTTAAPTNCTMNFTDALLNIARTGETFTLHAVPRRVVYMNSTGTKPGDSFAAGYLTIAEAAEYIGNILPAETIPVVYAWAAGYSSTEPYSIIIGRPALVLGGCESATWTRVPDTTTSRISLANLSNDGDTSLTIAAAGTLFDRMDIQQPNNLNITVSSANSIAIVEAATFRNCVLAASGAVTINASGSALDYQFINVGATTLFRDCVIKATNVTETASIAAVTFRLINLVAATEFDRCSILGEAITMNATGNSINCRAIEINTDSAVTILNSVVSPGTITYASGPYGTTAYGVYRSFDLTMLNIAGSTIHSGKDVSGNTNCHYHSVYLGSINNTMNISNSLFICDNPGGDGNDYALFSGSPTTANIHHTAIGFVNNTAFTIAIISGTSYIPSAWQGYGTANLFSLFSALGLLGSGDPTDPDFAKPSNTSTTLSTGGATLTTANTGFTLSGDSLGTAFAVDRLGNARTAPYTIGAYEYN